MLNNGNIHKVIVSTIKNYVLKFCSDLKETNWKARSTEIKGIKHEIVLSSVVFRITFIVMGTKVILPITL